MKNNRGFTLVEVAIVLIIGGILLASASSMLLTYMKKVQISTTEKRMEGIQEAMQLFLNLNGRYPCPAATTAAVDTAGFGVENPVGGTSCGGAVTTGRNSMPIVSGSVPVRTLNLPDDFIMDAWGGRFTYAVTKQLAETGTYRSELGAIRVVDSIGGNVTQPDLSRGAPNNTWGPGTAHYVVVSHGKNNVGAFSINGVQIAACAPASGQGEGENCDNDDMFRSTLLTSNAGGTNQNDDMVRFVANTAFGEWVPRGAVVAFNADACPNGWTEFSPAEGRFIIGANMAYPRGPAVDTGTRLNNGNVGTTTAASQISPSALVSSGGAVFLQPSNVFTTFNALPHYVALRYCVKS